MFQVKWIQAALDDLTNIWLEADSDLRAAITAASHELDERLERDPYGCSESRTGEVRVTFLYPLGVEIEIDLVKRIVWVQHVWRFRQRGQ